MTQDRKVVRLGAGDLFLVRLALDLFGEVFADALDVGAFFGDECELGAGGRRDVSPGLLLYHHHFTITITITISG